MSPLQIEILLWYHSRASDYRDADFSSPPVRDAIDCFRDKSCMIEAIPRDLVERATYRLTDKGAAFIRHILALPMPVCHWEIPAGESE